MSHSEPGVSACLTDGAVSAAVPFHWGGWAEGASNALMKGKVCFLIYLSLCQWSALLCHVAWRGCGVSIPGETQLDTALSLVWPCFGQGLHQAISRGASNTDSSYDPWAKLFCSKVAVYLIFLIIIFLSTIHNSAKYVTSSGTGEVLHLFFTVFLRFYNVKAWCISTDLCF